MAQKSENQYFHISYEPEAGWVLSMMTRLAKSKDARLQEAFKSWGATPLRELGFAVTTRIQMLGLCIHRLNRRVTELRKKLGEDEEQLQACLEKGYAFRLSDNHLAYEVLLDMDSFIFESRSLYELLGAFLCGFLEIVLQRKITEKQLHSILTSKGIDTRWIDMLRETRKLFFHETAPWLAIQVDSTPKRFSPILLKKNVVRISRSDIVGFDALSDIYWGVVNSLDALHGFVMEEIRRVESQQ
jgi:hypothetical protein